MPKKVIIYVPGLNDNKIINKNLAKFLPIIWNIYGYKLIIIYPDWKKENTFAPILNKILNTIDEYFHSGHEIYLMGQSAGGSAVLNAFTIRRNKVHKVINICGRLRKGSHVFPSLEFAAKGNPAFKESVLLFELINEHNLNIEDKKKIMTIKPIWDEVVPSSTVALNEAKNITIPVIEHTIGGMSALTVFSKRIAEFIK